MSIPVVDRTEYPISSLGLESIPSSVIVGSTLWTMFSSFGNLFLKEYEGSLTRRVRINISHFNLSIALNSDNSVNPDRFWLWEITPANVLNLVEIEPHSNADPIIVDVVQLKTNVLRVKSVVIADQYVNVFCLNNTSPKTLDLLVYQNVKSTVIDYTASNFYWNTTRLEDLGADLISSPAQFFISTINVASPSNVEEDEYTFEIPQITTIEQVPSTMTVHLIWDTITGVDTYILQRSKEDPLFLTPTEVYRGSLTDINDTITDGNFTYYYRVKARIDDAALESDWSATQSLFVIEVVAADFSAVPMSGDASLLVNFTDLSTGTPISWDWDFGDGSLHSTIQSPSHTYTIADNYTVSLTAANGFSFDTETKTDYITVNILANFSASTTIGNTPLIVNFTDLSSGVPTSWDWDFGDGSPHDTTQNPSHTYTEAGIYTVILIATRGLFSDIETKTNYITSNIVADFIGSPLVGTVPLIVNFTDTSVGVPTSWDWDFGDGSPHDTTQNPTHVYNSQGSITVTLIASKGLLSDTEVKTNYLTITNIDISYKKIFATLRTNRHVVKQLDAEIVPVIYDNNYFGMFTVPGGGSTGLNYPSGITVDFLNNVYICDFENMRIVKLNKNLLYIGQLSTATTIGKPCAIMFDYDTRCLYFTGVRYHSIEGDDLYMYLGVEKCSTDLTDVKYSSDVLGINRRLIRNDLTYKPNGICKGYLPNEILITGIRHVIYSTIESLTTFTSATEKYIIGEDIQYFRGIIKHSNGDLYLNIGTQIIRSNSTFVNIGDSNYVSKVLYGLKEDHRTGEILTYNADIQALIALDSDMNFANELYKDSGNTIATSFYDVFDVTANYIGLPRDIESILNNYISRGTFPFWATFDEPAHSTGFSPNFATQVYSAINRIQLINFSGLELVGDSSLLLITGETGRVEAAPIHVYDLRITGDLTVIIWHKWDGVPSSNGWMLDCSGNLSSGLEADNILYGIQTTNPGNITIMHENGSGILTSQTTPVVFPRDSLTHMLMVRRNATLKQYDIRVDNGSVYSFTYSDNPTGGSNATLSIGGKTAPRAEGKYYDAYVFADLLSDSEIDTFYAYGYSDKTWFDTTAWNSISGSGHISWKVV